VTGGEQPEQLTVGFCTENFFSVLGVPPMLGRAFLPEEQGRGGRSAVVLSYGVWQQRFGADPDIVGKPLQLDGASATVVGVMAPRFRVVFPPDSSVPDDIEAGVAFPENIYAAPLSLYYLRIVGRLKEDVSVGQAQKELVAISLAALHQVKPGFRTAEVMTFEVSLPWPRYPTDGERRKFARAFGERLAALPGVISQGAISHLPLDDFPNWYSPYAPIGVAGQGSEGLIADHRTATAGYFEAMGAVLLDGRLFDEHDDENHRNVVIVDDSFARKHWPGETAPGKRIRHEYFDNGEFLPREAEIVGVIRHIKHHALETELREQINMPYPQSPRPHLSYAIQARHEPLSALPALRAALRELDKDLAVSKVRPMEWYIDRATSASRFTTILANLFGGVALLLGLVGIYGVVSHSVGRRSKEIGVRMALGGEARNVVALVLKEGMGLAAVGLLLGLAGALCLTRYLGSLLYGVSHLDAATYLSTAVVMPVTALLSLSVPARRATRVNPGAVLRGE
jgi:predicted permease